MKEYRCKHCNSRFMKYDRDGSTKYCEECAHSTLPLDTEPEEPEDVEQDFADLIDRLQDNGHVVRLI